MTATAVRTPDGWRLASGAVRAGRRTGSGLGTAARGVERGFPDLRDDARIPSDRVDNLILIGDRVLVEPDAGEARTGAGLILPASVRDGERVGTGRVVAVGPGYLTANPDASDDEPWREARSPVRYLPVQAQPGDFAFYLRKDAVEITFRETAYVILPHAALLALHRAPAPPPADDLLRGLFGDPAA